MWDTVVAILIAYSIIVAFEYLVKAKFSAPQPTVATISSEHLDQLARYEENSVVAYGLPKRKCIGFKA